MCLGLGEFGRMNVYLGGKGLGWENDPLGASQIPQGPLVVSHSLEVEIHPSLKAIRTKLWGEQEGRPLGEVNKEQADARSKFYKPRS